MALRQRAWAGRVRAQLITQLGGKCVQCGSDYELEFDHKEPRDWEPEKKSSDHRICIYRREIKQGKIQLLCKTCNVIKGHPKPIAV